MIHFGELANKVSSFKKTNFAQLQVKQSRSIKAAFKHAPNKQFNKALAYSELIATHRGKYFKTTSKG